MSVEINATNFPGATFRDYVSSQFDTDGDGVLSDAEIAAVTSIAIAGNRGSGSIIGVEFFTELTLLKTSHFNYTNVSFANLTKLQTIEISRDSYDGSNPGLTLDFSSHSALKNLTLRSFVIASIAFNSEIENINITGGPAGTLTKFDIDVTNCANIQSLIITNNASNQMNSVTGLSNKTHLTDLKLPGDCINGNLDLSGCTALQNLDIAAAGNASSYPLTSLTLTGCTALKSLNCNTNKNLAGTLDLCSMPNLKNVDIRVTAFTSLLLGDHTLLEYLDYWNYTEESAYISEIDISKCPILLNLVEEVTVRHRQYSNTSGSVDYYDYYTGSQTDPYLAYDARTQLVVTGSAYIPTITSQPQDQTVIIGETATFSVTATGGDLNYSWEYGTPGNWYETIDSTGYRSGSHTDTLQQVAESREDAGYYRCFVYITGHREDGIYSDAALLTTLSLPTITTQPTNQTVIEGGKASFNVDANGNNLSYQWQSSTDDGETWTDIRGATGTTYQTTAALTMDGTQYRCKVSNTAGTVYSNAATLTVEEDTSIQLPVITQQPQSATVDEGNSATFTVTATGDDLHYQWQGNNTGTWFNITGETSPSYTIAGTLGTSGMLFRCIVSNDAGAARSEEAMITVTPVTNVQTPSISYNPNAVTVQEGNTASFRVVAAGGDLAYQWQVNRDGSWYNISDATSASYSFKAALTDNGTYYRCLVSNSAGSVYSSWALLTVTAKPDVTPNKPTKINKYFLVNGYDILPFIKDRGIKWSRNDVDGDNAGRVLGNANMQRDRLAIKVRCDLECRPLGTAEIQRLLAAIEPVFVTVQQNIDPRIGTSTRVMYSNNATVVIGTVYDDENDLYEDLTFPLIEQ